MIDNPLFTHERIKVYVDKDSALRCQEYTVVAHDRTTGVELGAFRFRVSDSGKQLSIDSFLCAANEPLEK